MSSEWVTSSLLDHYEVRSGLSKPAKDFGSGHPFLTFKDVFYNYFTPESLGDFVQSTQNERESCSILRGDVFLTRTSETMHELGMSCVALRDYKDATFNGFCKRLRPKPESNLLPEYVGYYLRSPKFRQAMLAFSTMSTRASLNNEMIGRLEISFPPRKTQTGISDILKSLDDRITLLRETNATLEAIAQALFKSWFVDFDPVHAKQQGRAPEGMDEATAALFPDSFVESELGLVPTGWRVSTVGHEITTVDYVANGSFASLKENVTLRWEPSYALYVRTTDHNSGFKGDFRYVDKPAFDFLSKSSLTGSDIVISNVGDVGTVFRPPKWLGMPMTLGSNAVALKNPKMSGFMFYFFKGDRGQHLIQSIVTGSAQLKFNKTNFRSLPFVVPIDPVLLKFEEIVGSLLEKIDENTAHAQALATLRDTLLPRLISGQLRLPDAEATVANAV
jgi:type I restriction enzyme S subunit